jgi:hypothetical protein
MALVEAFALGVCARALPTGPAVLAVRAKVKSLDAPLPKYGYVAPKITEIGWSCVTTTSPLGSVGCMILPTSSWRTPSTPSIGVVMRV